MSGSLFFETQCSIYIAVCNQDITILSAMSVPLARRYIMSLHPFVSNASNLRVNGWTHRDDLPCHVQGRVSLLYKICLKKWNNTECRVWSATAEFLSCQCQFTSISRVLCRLLRLYQRIHGLIRQDSWCMTKFWRLMARIWKGWLKTDGSVSLQHVKQLH